MGPPEAYGRRPAVRPVSLRCGRAVVGNGPMLFSLTPTNTVHSLRRPVTPFPKSHPQGKISPPWIGCGTDQSGCPTESYSDGNHNSQALSGDVNGGAATVGTMSLPLTPLVTDIQWPRWLKMGPAGPCPQKRNGQSTWGLPRHMGGVRYSARCPYGATEPSWAMVRCNSAAAGAIFGPRNRAGTRLPR